MYTISLPKRKPGLDKDLRLLTLHDFTPPIWHPTPVLLPGKSHGQRGLEGCNPWGRSGSDTTERLHCHFSLSCIGEENGNPLQCSCLENPRDGGAWWAAVHWVSQSRIRLKRLSSSSSSSSSTILYAQLKVHKLPLKIKLRALLKAWSPRVVLSCFFFSPFLFCSSFRTFNWSAGLLLDHLLAWASKTH